MLKTAVIKKCRKSDHDPKRPEDEQVWCLYTHDGKRLLGRHPTKEKAQKQEDAIQIAKHGCCRSSSKTSLRIEALAHGYLIG